MDRRLLALITGTVLAVAACGGSSTPTTAPVATSGPVDSAAPVASGETNPDVSLQPGAAGDLEGKLPSEANGITFQKTSFDGSSLSGAPVPYDLGEMEGILKANGKSVSDVRFAIASPKDAAAGATTTMMAIQVKGMDASKLLPLLDSSGTDNSKETTIAGKAVRTGGQAPLGFVLYVKDDVLYYILFADDATTEAILSQLP